jgi:hypothetical protein
VTEPLVSAVAAFLPDEDVAELRVRVRELVRGLTIAADMSGRMLPLSPELGEVWLALLVRPDLWRDVVPETVELVDVRADPSCDPAALFVEWLTRYLDRFGPMPADVVRYWPAARYLAAHGVDVAAVVR